MNSRPSIDAANLVLIPTALEQSHCNIELESLAQTHSVHVGLSGLGLIQSAVTTMQLIQQVRPSCVWLLGIAGTYSTQLEVATAYEFSRVACYGIGVGNGSNYRSPRQLGWQVALGHDTSEILHLKYSAEDRLLVSVVAASADVTEAELKLQAYPEALAEDMESYSVALACQLQGVPLRVIRGVSNRVGDRDPWRWQTAAAMHSAVELLKVQMKA